MWKDLLKVTVLAAAAAVLAFMVFSHASLRDRAFAAYNAGDYGKALPLFKQWASTPEVRNDVQKRNQAMAYILDMEQRTKGATAVDSTQGGVGGVAATTAPAGGGSGDQALIAKAMEFAMQQSKNPADPPTGTDRVHHKPLNPGETRKMTIKQMANFEYDPNAGGDVPADVRALDGGHLRLNGFMIPLTQAERVTEFALVPSLMGCCFGQPPGVQHVIMCRLPPNWSAEYSIDEVIVEGVIHVKIKREEGYTNSIFEMEVKSVKQPE